MLPSPTPYRNMPRTHPDEQGPAARAWRFNLDALGDHPLRAVNVAGYLMHAPASHPWWPWYSLAVVALREVEGVPAPTLQFPGATHEFLVMAANPDVPLPDVPDGVGTFSPLHPIDQCVQVILADDAQAVTLADLTVRAVCEGMLVPDQDHRARWAQVLATSAEHLRLGEHPS